MSTHFWQEPGLLGFDPLEWLMLIAATLLISTVVLVI
jgi:hypothetical protein